MAFALAETKGGFCSFCHGSSLARCRTARATAAAGSRVRPQKSIYGNPVPDLAAVTDLQNNNRVFGHFTAVVDHKEI